MQHTTTQCDKLRASFIALLALGLSACAENKQAVDLAALFDESADATQTGDSQFLEGQNSAPRIFGTPPFQAVTDVSYRFAPLASDSDGDRLSFSIRNLPNWATFNPNTGELTGTPTGGDVGSTGEIVISVSDAKTGTALLVSAFL